MTASAELRRLKSEITFFDCMNYEDLKFYTKKIAGHIRKISETDATEDTLLKEYIKEVLLKHLAIVEDFIYSHKDFHGREEFVSKSLKYHFNCIIDSYTYATIAYQH